MSNRQRIIDATVELMNKNGSAVGTTQLVDHLSISPGNLYYHFRNREEILSEILIRLQHDLDRVLILPADNPPDADALAEVLIGGARVLWQYRFFFSSSVELVTKDQQLREQYQTFCQRGIRQVNDILGGLIDSPAAEAPLSKPERYRLAEILWVLWTSWPRYVEVRSDSRNAESEMLRNHESLEFVLRPYLKPTFFRSVVRKTRKLQALEATGR